MCLTAELLLLLGFFLRILRPALCIVGALLSVFDLTQKLILAALCVRCAPFQLVVILRHHFDRNFNLDRFRRLIAYGLHTVV